MASHSPPFMPSWGVVRGCALNLNPRPVPIPAGPCAPVHWAAFELPAFVLRELMVVASVLPEHVDLAQ